MKHILHCNHCKKYTLKQICALCNNKTTDPKPAKYSPEDKYAKYRREIKKQELVEKRLL